MLEKNLAYEPSLEKFAIAIQKENYKVAYLKYGSEKEAKLWTNTFIYPTDNNLLIEKIKEKSFNFLIAEENSDKNYQEFIFALAMRSRK